MSEKILSFYLDGELFGIDIKLVKEINRRIKFTIVPGAPDFIVGLFNMRGQVVTIFDIACRIRGRCANRKGKPTCIVLKNEKFDGEYMGFIVDDLGDVLDVREGICEPPPGNMNHEYSQFISQIINFEDETIIDIDILKLLE